jgi:hypothetical protein
MPGWSWSAGELAAVTDDPSKGVLLKLSPELHAQVTEAAKRAGRSMHASLVRVIKVWVNAGAPDYPSVSSGGARAAVSEMDYRAAYLEIAHTVCQRFPTCEVTTVDMVRLLAHENDTLRMALRLPVPSAVLEAVEREID